MYTHNSEVITLKHDGICTRADGAGLLPDCPEAGPSAHVLWGGVTTTRVGKLLLHTNTTQGGENFPTLGAEL